jgi:L-threonine kinase
MRPAFGKAFGSFGEIVQGRLSDGRDFLVTLPIELWSRCELICTPIAGPLVIDCDLAKSRALVGLVLKELGIDAGFHISCAFTRSIPIGKGLSSSTADMLAALRAVQDVFGFLFTEEFISRLFAEVEPHDALHYDASTAYNHRRGTLIRAFGYIPSFTIVAVDHGGAVDTVLYNQTVSFSTSETERYDELFGRLERAFERRQDKSIAECATESARMHADRRGDAALQKAVRLAGPLGCLGVVAAHSGTCAGFLLPSDVNAATVGGVTDQLRKEFDGHVFVTRTLRLLR